MQKNAVFIIFLGILAAGFFGYQSFAKDKSINEPYATKKPCPYNNINPLRCEPSLAKKKKEYVVLKNDLLDFFEQQKKNNTLTTAAVYFRDLQNGPILNINEQEHFILASLLKLPLMIMYYKKAETDPALLQQKVTLAESFDTLEQNIKPEKTVERGKVYTVDELITLLITQSDNIAWELLLDNLKKYSSEEDFVTILSDLGIIDPRTEGDQDITVQQYASVFRILYNSSYLNLEMSDKALNLLSQSVFRDGIVAGVPESIQVAHKFGERKKGSEQQLHDCGIVYYPSNSYVLCIMTRGDDIVELKSIIKEVSQKVYKEVEERNSHE